MNSITEVSATLPISDDSDFFTYHDPDCLDSSRHIGSKYVVEGDAHDLFRFNDSLCFNLLHIILLAHKCQKYDSKFSTYRNLDI